AFFLARRGITDRETPERGAILASSESTPRTATPASLGSRPAMRIETFRMERMQCLYEKEVAFDLSESGVVPLSVSELLDGEPPERFLATRLAYPRSDGSTP